MFDSSSKPIMTFASLSGQRVLVTGSSDGIGRAIAVECATAGADLIVNFRQSIGKAESVAEEIRKLGRAADVISADVSRESDRQHLLLESFRSGRVDAIVNNAGVAFGSPFEPEPISEIRLQMEVNYFGPLRVIKEFLPVIRKQGGQIVNMSSISGKSSMPFNGAYCASKFALEAATDALRLELEPWGIPISNVLPGDVQTEIWRKATAAIDAAASQWSDEHKQLYGGTIEFMKNEIRSIDGSPPSDVARATEKLLRSRRPPARVFVGKNVYLYCFLEWLPTPLRDWLVLRRLAKLKSDQRQPSLGERL